MSPFYNPYMRQPDLSGIGETMGGFRRNLQSQLAALLPMLLGGGMGQNPQTPSAGFTTMGQTGMPQSRPMPQMPMGVGGQGGGMPSAAFMPQGAGAPSGMPNAGGLDQEKLQQLMALLQAMTQMRGGQV